LVFIRNVQQLSVKACELKKNDVIKLQVTDLAYGGRGVAEEGGKVVFVEKGLPGDILDVRIKKVKPDYCEGVTERIIQPSPHRCEPLCQHFGICGGCRWQNYNYNMQLKFKADQLKESLMRIGGLSNPPVEPIIGAKKIYFYRNKMEFSFNRDKNNNNLLGLHQTGFFDRVFDLNKCYLQSELSNEIVKFVKDECHRLHLPAYHIRNHDGLMRFLVIRESKFDSGVLVNIVTGKDYHGYEDSIVELGKNLADRFNRIESLLWTINSKKANIAKWDMYPEKLKNGILYGRDHIYEKLGRYRFRVSADSFFQTNPYQAQILYDTVVDYGQLSGLDDVCDLYCGTGTISVYISGLVRSVVGVESVAQAVFDARINAEENGLNNVDFIVGNVEDIIFELRKFNKVILDPPRAGLHPKALEKIVEISPEIVVYVSCNPTTLARDIAGFIQNGYNLQRAVAVDMFPHTYHIESVVKLVHR